MAPENPFPAHVVDAWGLLRWLGPEGEGRGVIEALVGRKGVDWGRVVLGGASAGGNVAAGMVSQQKKE